MAHHQLSTLAILFFALLSLTVAEYSFSDLSLSEYEADNDNDDFPVNVLLGDGKKDADCNVKGVCSWGYQDGFCQHATSRPGHHDKRYRIHSFAILHDELYIFSAMAVWRVPYSHPPYNLSHGIGLVDLSNELPNNMYRNWRMVNYNFAVMAFEIDAYMEVFFIATNLIGIDSCCSRVWHTQQIIRDRTKRLQPPQGTYRFAFNAFFGDGAKRIGNAVYNLDRFITGKKFFFHVRQAIDADNSTMRYTITRYEQSKPLVFEHKEYVIYPTDGQPPSNSTKEWYLESKHHLGGDINKAVFKSRQYANFPIVMLKNGYIIDKVMYLSKLDYLEVYQLEEVDGPEKIKMTWTKNRASENTIYCKTFDSENVQFKVTVVLSICYIFSVIVCTLLIYSGKINLSAVRIVMGPCSLNLEVSNEMIHNKHK